MEMEKIMEQKEVWEEEEMNIQETIVEHVENPEEHSVQDEERQAGPMGFREDDRGIGVIEIVLILVILIALVLVFKNEITSIVTNAFARISGDANSIIQ